MLLWRQFCHQVVRPTTCLWIPFLLGSHRLSLFCFAITLLHTHSLTHYHLCSCACCYDEIKGTQDLKIYSHADSQILSLSLASHTHTHSLSLVLVVNDQIKGTQDKDFSYSFFGSHSCFVATELKISSSHTGSLHHSHLLCL